MIHARIGRWACALSLLILAACTSCTPPQTGAAGSGTKEITLFAAASLTDVVNDLKTLLDQSGEFKIKASFGATSDLARQIHEGAPCDVFIAADLNWIPRLREQQALDGKDCIIARNTLVCIAPATGATASQLAELRHPEFARIAIAGESVPAGRYARSALRFYGLHDDLKNRFVGQKDVRAALRAVAAGECEAGFVYATDAKAEADVRTLFTFEQKSYPPIAYAAAVCAGSKNKQAARAFLEYLLGKQAQAALARRGFGPGETP